MHAMLADEDSPMTGSQLSHITINSQSSDEMQGHREAAVLVAVGSKRQHQNFPVENGMVSSSKYPKLEPEQSFLEPQEGQRASSSSDESSNESSDSENKNQEKNRHPSNESPDSINEAVQLPNEEDEAASLDSDAESEAISPQKEILKDGSMTLVERRPINQTNKLMLVPVLKRQHCIAQFPSNNDLENNNINSISHSETIKQTDSQVSNTNDENSDEPMNVISIPENSLPIEPQDGYLYQEECNQTEAHSNNADITGREPELPCEASNALYSVTAQSLNLTRRDHELQGDTSSDHYVDSTQSLRQPNLKIESSNSQDQNSHPSQDVSQEQFDDEQSIRHPLYQPMHQMQLMDNQRPSTSRGFEENNCLMNRAGSVSDLNLAHLVLSLKSDIQKLTEKVENQAIILDAVVNANTMNLSPMFEQSFQEKYNLKVPFSRIEDFQLFNEELDRNAKFCHEFTTSLLGYIDNDVSLAKNILNMVKQYMSRDLALLFNASKQAPNKMVLKDTTFCKCLLQATKVGIKDDKLPLEREKSFMKTLGHVISGARGWHNQSQE